MRPIKTMARTMTVPAALAGVLALAGCGSEKTEDQPTAAAEITSEAVAPSVETTVTETSATTSAATTPAAAVTTSAAATPSPKVTPTPETKVASAASPAAASGPPPAFAQCAPCHAVVPGKSGIGPSLAGVYGTKAGEVTGYSFSPALKASGLTWNDATLDKWLAAPMQTVPGTKMAYAGLKDAGQRKAVIAYMKSLK